MRVSKLCVPAAHEPRPHSCAPRRIVKVLPALGALLVFTQPLSNMPQRLGPQSRASSSVEFGNITRAAGIHFVHSKGSRGTSTILEEAGPGVCVADCDSDGWPDIYFVNGRDLYNRGVSARNALYHNNGDGTFTDVTEEAEVPGNAYGLGCVWGDYDNDGFPDLYVEPGLPSSRTHPRSCGHTREISAPY